MNWKLRKQTFRIKIKERFFFFFCGQESNDLIEKFGFVSAKWIPQRNQQKRKKTKICLKNAWKL